MSDHLEQETLDHLKAWWMRWGKLCSWGLAAVLLLATSWTGWNHWLRRQTAQAETLYEQFQQLADWPTQTGKKIDQTQVLHIVQQIENKFSRTPYAQMTALAAAKVFYQAANMEQTKAQLKWAIKHASDAEYEQLARLRLASVLFDEKAYDAALKLLEKKPSEAFRALYADRRGDILVAQQKPDEARQSYRKALQAFSPGDSLLRMTKFKLDALGG